MKLGLDFVLHWLWALSYAVLTISGIAMIGARFGWILDYNIALADYTHRLGAALFMGIACLAILQEIWLLFKGEANQRLVWGIFGKQGYGFFNLFTTLVLILTGLILWRSHHANMTAVAFSMFVHEQLTYIVAAGVIWHIYQKAHTLILPKQNASTLLQQPWYKGFVWFTSSAYFYIVASIMISLAGPQPSAKQIELFMTGMMKAMKVSLMGISGMHESTSSGDIIDLSAVLMIEMLILAFTVGAFMVWKGRRPDERS